MFGIGLHAGVPEAHLPYTKDSDLKMQSCNVFCTCFSPPNLHLSYQLLTLGLSRYTFQRFEDIKERKGKSNGI